jgi:hypothetical protein
MGLFLDSNLKASGLSLEMKTKSERPYHHLSLAGSINQRSSRDDERKDRGQKIKSENGMAKGGAERRQRKDDEEQQPDQYSQLRKASRPPRMY